MGKEVHEKIRTFKSSFIYLGIKEATWTPRDRCMLKKKKRRKTPNPEKILNSHLWLAFRLCASRM